MVAPAATSTVLVCTMRWFAHSACGSLSDSGRCCRPAWYAVRPPPDVRCQHIGIVRVSYAHDTLGCCTSFCSILLLMDWFRVRIRVCQRAVFGLCRHAHRAHPSAMRALCGHSSGNLPRIGMVRFLSVSITFTRCRIREQHCHHGSAGGTW